MSAVAHASPRTLKATCVRLYVVVAFEIAVSLFGPSIAPRLLVSAIIVVCLFFVAQETSRAKSILPLDMPKAWVLGLTIASGVLYILGFMNAIFAVQRLG